jgi:dipeptidyl aminopeptidase/acylaminoacyl peptidase
VTDLETGASRRVGAPSPVAEPSWSPDGDLLAYRSGSSTIGVIDIDTGDRSTVLRLRRGSVVGFDWMPHGSHILFTRSRYVQRPGPTPSHDCYNAHHVVELLSLDGAREVLFRLPAYPGPYARPSVAPDGSMVVVEFLRDRPGDAACGGDDDLNEIGLIDLSDGTTARLVVDEDHHSQDPAWQPA